MTTTPTFLEINQQLLGFPISTQTTYLQRLREDQSIYPRGKQGGGAVQPSASHVANLLIALAATPSSGRKTPDALATVRKVRAARRLRELYKSPELNFIENADGLKIESCETFGEAIDSLIDDMRSGRYSPWIGTDIDAFSSIRFYDHGARIFVNLRKSEEPGRGAFLVFRNDDMRGEVCLTRCTEVDVLVLQRMAKALGPLPAS